MAELINYTAVNACTWRGGSWIPGTTKDLRQGAYSTYGDCVGVMVFDLSALRAKYATHYVVGATLRLTRTASGSYAMDKVLALYAGNQTGIPAVSSSANAVAAHPAQVTGLYNYTVTADQTAKSIDIDFALVNSLGSGASNCLFMDAGSSTSQYMSFVGRGDLSKVVLQVSWEQRVTACGAPTACAFSPTVSEGNASLTWSGAKAGMLNAIFGYEVQSSESADGINWGAWTAADVIYTSATGYTLAVSPPSTRGYVKRMRVRTMGAAGAAYDSPWKVSTNTLSKATLPSAPTACSVSATLAKGNVLLSWNGAASGAGHAIAGYAIEYCESSNGTTWGAWTALTSVATTATSGAASVTPPTTQGDYRRFRVRAYSALGTSYYSPWKESTNSVRRNVQPSSPTNIKVVPQNYAAESLTFSWGTPTAGTSALSYYRVYYQESTDSGTTWSALAVLKDVSAPTTSTAVSPRQVSGLMTRYSVQAVDALGDTSSVYYSSASVATCNLEACTAPNSVNVSASIVEGTATLSWSGAAGGAGNAIVSYEIQYSDGASGGTWGAWSAYTTVSTTSTSGSISIAPPTTRGYYRRFQIRVRGTAGAGYFSGWTLSPSIRKNTLPTPPTSLLVNPTVYQMGDITLSWTGASGGTSAIRQYLVQRQISQDNVNWDAWESVQTVVSSLGNGTLVMAPPSSWRYLRFRVSVTDALGAVSDYAVSASVRKNSQPIAPTVAAPMEGAITYNKAPRVLIETHPNPDGAKQVIWVLAVDGHWYNSVDHPSMFSVSGATANGIRTIFTNPPALPGAVTLSVECRAADMSGVATMRSFAVLGAPFEEITANITHCKAAHILGFREAINHVRHYYGMAAYAWGYEVTGGRTNILYWPFHVLELRAAIQGIADRINAFAGQTIIPPFAWLPIGTGRPRADVMNQLMDALMPEPILHTFGVAWRYGSGSGTALTRLADAVGLEAPFPAKGTGVGSSPFDDQAPWKDMDEFNVINGAIAYRKGEAGFSRTLYDTVVRIPKFWYKTELDETASAYRWYVSNIAQAGFTVHPAFDRGDGVERDFIYVGRYATSAATQNVYATKSGVSPVGGMSRATARANSAAKGAGWWQFDYAAWCAVWLLYLVEFADWGSQGKIGNGWISKSDFALSGGTDAMTYHTGRASAADNNSNIQYRCIEDLWGNIHKWLDGVTFQGAQGYAVLNPVNFTDGQAGTGAVNLGAQATGNGNPNKLSRPIAAPWAYMPQAVGGGRVVPDYYSYGGGAWSIAYQGGRYNSGGNSGLMNMETNYASSGTSGVIGSRLMFLP
jgi:hypothetical protein